MLIGAGFPPQTDFEKKFQKGIDRFLVWSKNGCFNSTWKKINMQQTAVFWWKSKKIFPTKNVLIRSLKKFEWGRLVSHEATES